MNDQIILNTSGGRPLQAYTNMHEDANRLVLRETPRRRNLREDMSRWFMPRQRQVLGSEWAAWLIFPSEHTTTEPVETDWFRDLHDIDMVEPRRTFDLPLCRGISHEGSSDSDDD